MLGEPGELGEADCMLVVVEIPRREKGEGRGLKKMTRIEERGERE